MEKSVRSILKIYNKKIEDMLAKKASIESNQETLNFYKEKIENDFQIEKKIVSKDPSLIDAFQAYSNVVDERRSNIEVSLADLQKQKDKLQNNIFTTYKEVKVYETILSEHAKKKKKSLEDQENKDLDDISTLNYIFKKNQ